MLNEDIKKSVQEMEWGKLESFNLGETGRGRRKLEDVIGNTSNKLTTLENISEDAKHNLKYDMIGIETFDFKKDKFDNIKKYILNALEYDSNFISSATKTPPCMIYMFENETSEEISAELYVFLNLERDGKAWKDRGDDTEEYIGDIKYGLGEVGYHSVSVACNSCGAVETLPEELSLNEIIKHTMEEHKIEPIKGIPIGEKHFPDRNSKSFVAQKAAKEALDAVKSSIEDSKKHEEFTTSPGIKEQATEMRDERNKSISDSAR